MTPEVESHIKSQTCERMRQRNGEDWVEENSEFLETRWEWAKKLGMVDTAVRGFGSYAIRMPEPPLPVTN